MSKINLPNAVDLMFQWKSNACTFSAFMESQTSEYNLDLLFRNQWRCIGWYFNHDSNISLQIIQKAYIILHKSFEKIHQERRNKLLLDIIQWFESNPYSQSPVTVIEASIVLCFHLAIVMIHQSHSSSRSSIMDLSRQWHTDEENLQQLDLFCEQAILSCKNT